MLKCFASIRDDGKGSTGDLRRGEIVAKGIILKRFFALATFVAMAGMTLITPARAGDNAVTLEASNWKFTSAQSTIEAHVGVPTTLRVTSKEGVHGIKSDELGISNTILIPEKTVTVTFTPKKAGEYKVYCSIPCGGGHADMAFTVKVEE